VRARKSRAASHHIRKKERRRGDQLGLSCCSVHLGRWLERGIPYEQSGKLVLKQIASDLGTVRIRDAAAMLADCAASGFARESQASAINRPSPC